MLPEKRQHSLEINFMNLTPVIQKMEKSSQIFKIA